MDDSDVCTAILMYLIPLNNTLKNNLNGKFYVTSMLLQHEKLKRSAKGKQMSF